MSTAITVPKPEIEFIFPNQYTKVMPILGMCRGIINVSGRPVAFRFLNCTNEHITNEFIDWYFSMVLPCLDTNVFKYRLSVATAPSNFRAILALPKEPTNVI